MDITRIWTWAGKPHFHTANEEPLRIQYKMSGSHLCIPRNEFVHCAALLFPKQNYNFNFLSPRFIYFRNRSVYIAASKYVDHSWEYINRSQTHEWRIWDLGRASPFPGIHKFDFRYSACAMRISSCSPPPPNIVIRGTFMQFWQGKPQLLVVPANHNSPFFLSIPSSSFAFILIKLVFIIQQGWFTLNGPRSTDIQCKSGWCMSAFRYIIVSCSMFVISFPLLPFHKLFLETVFTFSDILVKTLSSNPLWSAPKVCPLIISFLRWLKKVCRRSSCKVSYFWVLGFLYRVNNFSILLALYSTVHVSHAGGKEGRRL